MSELRRLHRQAMTLADRAYDARRYGRIEEANELFRQAYG